MASQTRNRREDVDGVLLLNKPAGITSNQALQRVKRLLNAKKAGHTGSLDPAATGMLPLCFGEATKVCAFLLNADKTYRVTVKLGIATDTGDRDGTESKRKPVPGLSAQEWDGILQAFVGETTQVPPMYSALKKDGKRLYELAREGVAIEREPRPIRVDDISLLEIAGDRLVFRVRCSKGTYIRSLVEDVALAAGTVAHTAYLHRERVGDFDSTAMLDLTVAEAIVDDHPNGLKSRLLPADSVLLGYPAVTVDDIAAEQFRMGQTVHGEPEEESGLVRVYGASDAPEFLGVGQIVADGCVAPKRVFRSPASNGK